MASALPSKTGLWNIGFQDFPLKKKIKQKTFLINFAAKYLSQMRYAAYALCISLELECCLDPSFSKLGFCTDVARLGYLHKV